MLFSLHYRDWKTKEWIFFSSFEKINNTVSVSLIKRSVRVKIRAVEDERDSSEMIDENYNILMYIIQCDYCFQKDSLWNNETRPSVLSSSISSMPALIPNTGARVIKTI